MYLASSLIRLFDLATERSERAFRALPEELQGLSEVPYFVARDIPAHLIQSEQLAIGFIADQAGVPGWQFKLHPALITLLHIADPVERAAGLRMANFKGARGMSTGFVNYGDLVDKWLAKRREIRGVLDRLCDTQMGAEISHPLVTLQGPIFIVALELLYGHALYHLGQFTQSMKNAGHADIVPFPFGRIDTDVPKVAKRYMAVSA